MGLFDNMLPSHGSTVDEKTIKPINDANPKKNGKFFKAVAFALGLTSTYGTRGILGGENFESSPYDFDQIIRAIDTDGYAKQAFAKYQELMWKEGYEVVGENEDAVSYIFERFDYIELVMGLPISELFKTMTDQLCKFHNAVIAEVRNKDFKRVFPGMLSTDNPIVGYEVIPMETVRIIRDQNNKPLKYQQELDGYGGYGQPSAPEWDASEVIHLAIDRKPGYLFGTPFMTAAIEDIIALRTMEEDIQNLVHQELFPIVDVTVGTEGYPGENDEVMQAAQEIADMRHDGALIHTERRSIKIIGSQGNALDASEYLHMAQQRVAVGLGLYPHHLGMMFAGGNRNMTQQLDIALYDRIKTYQRYTSSMIVLFIINRLLREGGFDPMRSAGGKESDRCAFRFREIDTDTRIKKETHVIQKFQANLETLTESRLELNLRPEMDESETLAAMTARLAPNVPTAAPVTTTGAPAPTKKDAQVPSTGGAPNPKNHRRGVANKMRPQNQHGRSNSPKVRHNASDVIWLEAAELLSETEELND